MGTDTAIEWTDHTFNPWEGCQKVGPGCDNCYAEARNARFGGGTAPNWGPGAPRRLTSKANWRAPLKWAKRAAEFQAEHGRRQRVFCASLADVFDNAVDPAWRADLFELIRQTPELDWLLLTKRVGNVSSMLPEDWGHGWDHVWLGITVVNQDEADRDIPKLEATPAAVRFLSVEPMLGAIQFPSLERVDWVICGGESGDGARPMHPEWARQVRDQCAAADVPFLFKQWGDWLPVIVQGETFMRADGARSDDLYELRDGLDECPDDHPFWTTWGFARVGKKKAGRFLEYDTHNGFPDSPAA
ncbi:Gp37Gp68 family protein [Tetraselmis viridis virus SI1]|uniref:Gp37Gp68 family protein n=1 Tax=Tetraselmis viridis virus S20 TaxID=754070 RepID=UPI0002C0BAB9|nr:Gp37Gp68 family protein [Tetraselmis viridis virus S20]AGH31349.1 Gp37Gp68 family protein [Tetraselmis viridis virus S20]AGH31437.1 Gp37Gp68 family protein [Tetraselmis viridis virus SI1]